MILNVDLSDLFMAVRRMGAKDIDFGVDVDQEPLSPIDVGLDEGGIEVDFSEIDFDTGLASYQGRQVLLYIRDHGSRVTETLQEPEKGNKFHVADCSKLDEMRRKGRIERYVVTNNLNGAFKITGDDWRTGSSVEGEAELKVCKLCLGHLNYKGYTNKPKGPIFKSFSIGEFFETYSSYFKHMPQGFAAKPNQYSADWDDLSKQIRQSVNYQCQQCGLSLSEHRNLLHVHHKNGVRNDNRRENLVALCADCHRKQPDHQHMFISHQDSKKIAELRRAQSIVVRNSWAEVYALADPAMHGVIDQLEKYHLPIPEVGYRIDGGQQSCQIELAWPKKQVGISIERDDAVIAHRLGWKVSSMRLVLADFDAFINLVR
jgi:hypothetical protein